MSIRNLMMGDGGSGGVIAEFTLTAGSKNIGFGRATGYDTGAITRRTFGSLSSDVYTYNGTEYTVTYFCNMESSSGCTYIGFGLPDGQIVKFSVDDVEYTVTYGDSSTYPRVPLTDETTYTIKILSIS